jgi:hypothetical protein
MKVYAFGITFGASLMLFSVALVFLNPDPSKDFKVFLAHAFVTGAIVGVVGIFAWGVSTIANYARKRS